MHRHIFISYVASNIKSQKDGILFEFWKWFICKFINLNWYAIPWPFLTAFNFCKLQQILHQLLQCYSITWGNKVFCKKYLSKHAIANIVYANVMHNEMIKNVIVNVYIELRLTAQKHSGILFMLSTVVKYEMKYSLCIKNAKKKRKVCLLSCNKAQTWLRWEKKLLQYSFVAFLY